MVALQLSFWPTHSEWLSLPNAFNMDPLVSNSWIQWWWFYFDHNVVVANSINCDHLIKRDPTGASTWLIIMTTITAQNLFYTDNGNDYDDSNIVFPHNQSLLTCQSTIDFLSSMYIQIYMNMKINIKYCCWILSRLSLFNVTHSNAVLWQTHHYMKTHNAILSD